MSSAYNSRDKDLKTKIEESEKRKAIFEEADNLLTSWQELSAAKQKEQRDSLLIDLAMLPPEDRKMCLKKLNRGGIIGIQEGTKIINELAGAFRPVQRNESEGKVGVKTLVPGGIHLIKGKNSIEYLLLSPEGHLEKKAEVLIDGVKYRPKQDLPILYPSEKVFDYFKKEEDRSGLLRGIELFIDSHVELPNSLHPFMLALWVVHTYLIDFASCTPILYFYGVKETGKSRAGEVLSKIAFRAERLTSPTEATLFRSAHFFKTTLIIDELKLWGQDGSPEVARLIKSRYKRGLKVSRVNLERKIDEEQIEYYDVFAPLVICTTETMPDPIEDRSLIFNMQRNVRQEVENDIDEENAQMLRNRLTALRAKLYMQELPIPEAKIGRRRLKEIIYPLQQVLMAFDPAREEELKEFASEVETMREEEASLSFDAEMIQAVIDLYNRGDIEGERFAVKKVADLVNEKRSDKDAIKTISIGWSLKRLGFKNCRTQTGERGYLFNKDLMAKKCGEFKLDDDPFV